MKTLLFIISCCVVVVLNSCSSNPTSPSTDTTTLYMPLTAGSMWTYTGSIGNTIDVMAGDSVLLGHTYRIMIGTANGTSQPSVLRAVGTGINITMPDTNGVLRDVVYIKDGIKTGDSWSNYSTNSGIPSFYDYTCLGTGLTRTVQGKSYTNVMALTQTIGYNFGGQRIVAGTATTYFAMGVGMIATDLSNGQSMELVSYSIK